MAICIDAIADERLVEYVHIGYTDLGGLPSISGILSEEMKF